MWQPSTLSLKRLKGIKRGGQVLKPGSRCQGNIEKETIGDDDAGVRGIAIAVTLPWPLWRCSECVSLYDAASEEKTHSTVKINHALTTKNEDALLRSYSRGLIASVGTCPKTAFQTAS